MPSGVFLNHVCASTSIPSTSTSAAFVDYYEVLSLDPWATPEHIKSRHRQLRGEFFRTNPDKYRALQAAYAVLMDPEAKLLYDTAYLQRLGLPPPRPLTPSPASTPASTPPPTSTQSPVSTASSPVAALQKRDPNWGLKHYNPVFEPVLGSEPYHSFVPMSEVYMHMYGKDPTAKCSVPRYRGDFAINAQPV
ncbi:hypothetical protein CC80DRAFT_399050 [Byssothecium circinans]|uniref:J domain-containing protein n=1 Tax=Byssothecium circinans TaxID=147558 RepID=A0A6A5UDN6_9PLEO|nr:hypothetical protein CC80DRAFT_399050 [Byssothecium circinans]